MRNSVLLTILASVSLFACGEDEPGGGDACDSSTLTYANFGMQFMDSFCTECHSANSANRMGAPSNRNFDSLSDVDMHKGRVKARSGTGTTMPPSTYANQPSTEERADLVEWIDCGPK